MDMPKFCFPIVRVDGDGKATGLAGTAFPITPGGGLITCRHVIDIADDDGQPIPTAVMDRERRMDRDRLIPIVDPIYLDVAGWDMAFLPAGLGREHPHYFPILPLGSTLIGRDVYSIGYYNAAGQIQRGYFAGSVVGWRGAETRSTVGGFAGTELLELVLPYAVIEGLSGAPVLTDHNGPKVVGMCHGSESQRVLAQELIETRDETFHYKETLHRIVEFGVAYDQGSLRSFLKGASVLDASASGYVETDDQTDIPGLSD